MKPTAAHQKHYLKVAVAFTKSVYRPFQSHRTKKVIYTALFRFSCLYTVRLQEQSMAMQSYQISRCVHQYEQRAHALHDTVLR